MLLDQTQAIAQNFTRILVTPGMHQGFDQLVLVIAEDDVARGHVGGSRSVESTRQFQIGILCQRFRELMGGKW